MRARLDELYEELERVPEDWSVRLRLIESAIERRDRDEARRLVRTSPDEGPLPGELQEKIFALLTRDWDPTGELATRSRPDPGANEASES